MCLILFAHDAHPEYRLVVAANRDEFHARPTAPAAPWPGAPQVIAGRDLRAGGTWMGVDRAGRWAAVTNYREMQTPRPDAPSRGALVRDYLLADASAPAYLQALRPRAAAFAGFNLLVGDGGALWWFSNRAAGPGGAAGQPLDPGVYGLSNHLLDTPWPKVERGKRELAGLLAAPAPLDPERLLGILLDRTLAEEARLPDTGVDPERERALSASFIVGPAYGTRTSTVLLMHRQGRVTLVERTFRPDALEPVGEVRHSFDIEA